MFSQKYFYLKEHAFHIVVLLKMLAYRISYAL